MRFSSVITRLSDMGPSGWAVHRAGRQMKANGEDVIELSIGEPDVPIDKALLDEASRALNAGRTRYANARGEPALLKALVKKYLKRRSDVTDRNFLCFPGTQSALHAVMASLVENGDGVLVGNPLYATYEAVIRATGAHPVYVPLRAENRFHLQAVDLEQAITPQSRVLLLNTPHNPTGAVLSRAEIIAIGEICRRHDLLIVCDEVYEELIFDNVEFASPFDLPQLADRTIVVSSISKSHAATGFRSGWCAAPEEFCNAVTPYSEALLFGGQPFIADMTALALSRQFDMTRIMRDNFQRRAAIVGQAFSGSTVIRPMLPDGGMFALLDVAATGLAGEPFAWELLKQEKVSVMPGNSFGVEGANFIRVSLTVPDDKLFIATERIKRLAERIKASVSESDQGLGPMNF